MFDSLYSHFTLGSDTQYRVWLLYKEKGLNEYVAIFTVAKDEDTLLDVSIIMRCT